MRFYLIILLFTTSFIGNSQDIDSLNISEKNYSKNRTYIEMFGVPNTFISLNYERVLFSSISNKIELSSRTGFGYSYFKNHNSHLYSIPVELNYLMGSHFLKLDVGISYVYQYRTEAIDKYGFEITNSNSGNFYHYSFRIGCRFNTYIDDNHGIFFRMSVGKNFTPKKLIRNTESKSNSSKLISGELWGLTIGLFF